MKLLIVLSLLLSFTAGAQVIPQTPEQEPSAPATDASTGKPAPKAGTPEERVFTPSEEVSADKEVDFPADL